MKVEMETKVLATLKKNNTVKKFAESLPCSEGTARKYFGELEEAGKIEKIKGVAAGEQGRPANTYRAT